MSYRFLLNCPEDGHPLRHLASGTTDGWETRATARCDHCGSDLLIHVQVAVTNRAERRGAHQRASVARARAVHHDHIEAARSRAREAAMA